MFRMRPASGLSIGPRITDIYELFQRLGSPFCENLVNYRSFSDVGFRGHEEATNKILCEYALKLHLIRKVQLRTNLSRDT